MTPEQRISELRYLAKFKSDDDVLGSVPYTLLEWAADEIERLRAALSALLPYADNSDSPGGCNGKYADFCEHCSAIKSARAALEQREHPDTGGVYRPDDQMAPTEKRKSR